VKPPRRILVRGVNWLGDAVMTTPALLRLRERFPDAHVAILTPEKLRDIWTGHPAVNEVIPFTAGEGLFSIRRKLAAENFDLALVLPNSHRSALEPWLARIPRRLGCARPWRNWLLTEAVPPRPAAVKMRKRSVSEIRELIGAPSPRPPANRFPATAHQMHEYLHLAAALGASAAPLAPRIEVSAGRVEEVRRKFRVEAGVRWHALNGGAEYGPAKRWPATRFAEAASRLQARLGGRWLILGGPGDAPIANEIEAAMNRSVGGGGDQSRSTAPINVAGKSTLGELCALLRACDVLLSNDTGPAHLAAALGVPLVTIFGSTSPELTGPGLPGDPRIRLLRSEAHCTPCFLRTCPIDFRCMNGISVESVVDAVAAASEGGS
jgi:heptosyltransferase-2